MSYRVLIVDDDEKIRELLRRFLEPEGYQITEVASAEAAMQYVETAPPSVALCDVHMGGANGLWLADQIRGLCPATAMVLATGETAVPPAESLRSGVVAYLLKPLRRDRVVAAVAAGIRWSQDAISRGAHSQQRRQLLGD